MKFNPTNKKAVAYCCISMSYVVIIGDNDCAKDGDLGCSHLCLPTGRLHGRCACPSKGGLVLSSDGKTCTGTCNIDRDLINVFIIRGFFFPNEPYCLAGKYVCDGLRIAQ